MFIEQMCKEDLKFFINFYFFHCFKEKNETIDRKNIFLEKYNYKLKTKFDLSKIQIRKLEISKLEGNLKIYTAVFCPNDNTEYGEVKEFLVNDFEMKSASTLALDETYMWNVFLIEKFGKTYVEEFKKYRRNMLLEKTREFNKKTEEICSNAFDDNTPVNPTCEEGFKVHF